MPRSSGCEVRTLGDRKQLDMASEQKNIVVRMSWAKARKHEQCALIHAYTFQALPHSKAVSVRPLVRSRHLAHCRKHHCIANTVLHEPTSSVTRTPIARSLLSIPTCVYAVGGLDWLCITTPHQRKQSQVRSHTSNLNPKTLNAPHPKL